MAAGSATQRLAGFVVESSDLPSEVIEAVDHALVDTLGVGLAGSREACTSIALGTAVRRDGPGGAIVWGHGARLGPADAAFVNGIAGHALDFDDTLASLRGHSSVTTVPVALALGESVRASGSEVLDALALGLEVAGRIGKAMGHGHYLRGWHSTATVGAFAATAVAARLLRLDVPALCHAWGIAAAQSGGLVRNFGTMAKPFQAGHAARAGVLSANLAAAGMTADPGVLDGPGGFPQVYGANGPALDEVLADLGRRWEAIDPGLNVKRWPCCYCSHRALGGLLEMLRDHGIERHEVVSVSVGFPPGSDEPLIYADPRTGLQGKFSIEYPIAAVLLDGRLGLQSFTDEMVRRESVRALMSKVRRVAVPDTGTFSGTVGYTDLEVETIRGRWTRRITAAPGSREWPVGREERREKFLDCASIVLAGAEGARLLEAAERCADLPDIGALARLSVPAEAPAARAPGAARAAAA